MRPVDQRLAEHFGPQLTSDRLRRGSRQKFNILKPYLPKYFSSEWSHSQFRLPPPAPPSSRLPFSLSNPSETGRSTPTIEDDKCVCAWIEVPREGVPIVQPPTPTAADVRRADSESRKGKERERDPAKENRRHNRGSSRPDPPPTPPPLPALVDSQIVALTHSGGWFRISLGAQPPASPTTATPVPSSFGLGKDSTSDCRLEEYRRFGSKDGW